MVEFRQRHGLCAEAFEDFGLAGQFGLQHLDGDFAFEHGVEATVDRTHAAFADLLDDLIIADNLADHYSPPHVLLLGSL